jgi:GH35 family endo-1,4-beta-xylanase
MLKKTLLMALSMTVLAVQAQQKYEIGNPNDEEHYGYLKDYKALKEYIDYEKYPNFKLGVGTTVNDYLQKGLVYKLTNANFTETVAGNAMKQASCVSNNGTMNFTTVKNYVNAATAAGLNVYGHTLAWHSQQAAGWLRGLIKDKPAPALTDGDTTMYVAIANKDFRTQQNVGWHSSESDYGYTLTFDATNGLKVHCTKKCTNSWDVQYIAMDNIPTEQGGTYQMTMTVRGSKAGTIHSKLGDWGTGVTANIPFTTEWKEVNIVYKNTLANAFFLLQNGDFVGDIYIKNITFSRTVMGKKVTEERRCLKVEADQKVNEVWDNQFWIVTGSFAKGAKYEFSADVRADKSAQASTQVHASPSSYVDSNGIGRVSFSTEWKTVKVSGTFSNAGSSIAFNLNELADANNYYFDNVSLKVNGVEKVKNGTLEGTDVSSFKQKLARGNVTACTIAEQIDYVYVPSTIPLSDKERHDTLVYAMDKWIKGMMEACGGKVKAWDVVNEAISGGNADSEGVYSLQHDNGSTSDFFWQDYMGDLEYARQAIRLARKYGPSDLTLFINDYNLESDWDNNGKLKSLIKWIQRWEADGVTRVDGIGSQMHISCYMNAQTQASKKNGILNMLKLMAATGKKVRISELDMGMVDANGKDVPTSQMTEAMHQRMADLYEWIFKKYFEVVPVEQQWGICQWCATDSPTNSGWRADTPVGLWTLSYYRKHTYAGVAKGLGAVVTALDEVKEESETVDGAIFDIRGNRLNVSSLEELPTGLYIVGGKKIFKK